MKRCPQCNRTYHDEFSFCLIDGSILSAPYDPQETLVLQTPPQTNKERDPTLLDSNDSPLSRGRSEGLYLEFWQGFLEFCRVNGTFLHFQKPSGRYWLNARVGRSYFTISLTASTQKRRLGCEIYIYSANAKEAFKLLENDKQAIEEKTGPLEWQELPDKHDCRIVLYRWNVDITDKSTWNDAYAWFKSKAELFHNAFSPFIRRLPQ